MISPLVLAGICEDVYKPTPIGFDNVWDFGGTHAAHRKLEAADVVVFRGSLDTQDWLRDAEAVPFWDHRIGFVHAGFMAGMNDILVAVSLLNTKKIVITGHSLGGARARILAALFAHAGQPVAQCCVFGSPRPGFANLGRVLRKSGTPLQSYRNRNDPVPLVPFFGGLYQHPDQWIELDAAPAEVDLDPLRDHKIALYANGLLKLNLQEPT